MCANEIVTEIQYFLNLADTAKELLNHHDFNECEHLIANAMCQYPNSPAPHNMMGMLLEQKGNHPLAMKHFRAAWALDPTYVPARYNLEHYGSFFVNGMGAFDERDCKDVNADCSNNKKSKIQIEYDANGVGHVVRRP